MDLRKFGFTVASATGKKKKEEVEKKEKKKEYEKKRERNFQSSWLEEFQGLMYAIPVSETGEESGSGSNVMFCKTCLDIPECSDKTSSLVIGTSIFRKDTLVAHWKSRAHISCDERTKLKEKAKQFATKATTSKEDQSYITAVGPIVDCARKIDKENEEKIKKLINTAYHVCKSECPFTDYSKLIVLQEKNGLDMGNFYRSDNACRRFVKTVYDDLVSTPLEKLRTDVNFFTILIDGATDVSVTENELIYVRLLQDGIPANKYFSIEDVESADAAGVLNSINEAFDRHGLPDWKEKLIGFGSDGASVNLGNRSGVAKQIKDEVPHLIITHCVAHRLELAANNAIKHHKIMREIQDILQHMYKHYHYSPKALRELRKLAEALEEKILKPTNLSGTRWLPFIESALHVLVVDFRVILAYFEHVVESRTGSAEVQGRAHFISKKLKDYKFLYLTFFVLDVLKVLSILSKTMQRDDLTLSQLFDALTTAHLALAELRSTNGNQLSNFLSEVVGETFRDISLKNVHHEENYATIKQEMLDLICKALDDRFGPSEKDPLLLAAAKITDFNDWPREIQNLASFGQDQLNLLLQHFQDILNRSGCDLEIIKNEWTDFKAYIYRHKQTDISIFFINDNLKTRFKNLLFLLEIIQVFPLSSAACERGFSAMKRIKSDWRSSLKPDMLQRLLFIAIEGPSVPDFNVDSVFIRWWSTGRPKHPGFNPYNYRMDRSIREPSACDFGSDDD